MDHPMTDEIKETKNTRPKHKSRKLCQAFLNTWSIFSVSAYFSSLSTMNA